MNASIFIFTLCLLLFLGKWIIIAILFPFQCANGAYQTNKGNFLLRVLAAPYNKIEGIIFHGGWQRYMLFQVSVIPSCHIRKWIYKSLGANIGPRVVFHFKTEIRAPHKLTVGGGYDYRR